MPCYGPLNAYRPPSGAADRRLVFRADKSESGIPIKIPCGRCAGCRLEHSRQWAVRCMHEKRLHSDSAFLTLTYDDAHLPPGGTLVKEDLQNFMKRLRHVTGPNLRFFACGEYGEKTARPHYHVLLLSASLSDRSLVKSGSEYNLYDSRTLRELWKHGNHVIGDVTFESCAYVARYCMKKITGDKDKVNAHYKGRTPEYIVMSRRPGLGTGYFEKYHPELLSHDTIIVNGVPAALPRFYDNKIAHLLGDDKTGLYTGFELIKIKRRRKLTTAMRRDNGTTRLRVREVVAMAKLKQKVRTL